jgi:hypothetical protein
MIGERIKAMRSPYREFIKELVNHKLFNVWGYSTRDAHWNLATQFFKAVYTGNPLARAEFQELKKFLENHMDESRALKAKEQTNRILNYESKVFNEAVEINKDFEGILSSPRTLKWVFACLMTLMNKYNLTGKEHLIAQGLINYYGKKAEEGSTEWTSYANTGRSGRIDTDEVTICLSQLLGYMVNASQIEPLDQKRLFSSKQRDEIWQKSGKQCKKCAIPLTKTNFHADHIKPYSEGGPTDISNGQVLCAKCNLSKGKDIIFANKSPNQ